MGFFRRLFGMRPAQPSQRYLTIYAYSKRCAAALTGRVDLFNELSAGEEGEEPYFVRKVLDTQGHKRCFDQVEVALWLDANKRIVRHEVTNGMWLEPDEYERLRIARASTLEDDTPGGGSASDMDETEKPGGNPNAR